MDISIIIPIYKGNKYIPRLLMMIEQNHNLLSKTAECEIELILINDYPLEKLHIPDKAYPFHICVKKNDSNAGIHASRTHGLDLAKGYYVVFLDQDDLISDNYLLSQWKTINNYGYDYLVCNGWWDRFSLLLNENNTKFVLNDIETYLVEGNAIYSPGQVIIRRTAIPTVWKQNVLKENGADDFFLWIAALRLGHTLYYNPERLFFHTPQRTEDSIGIELMMKSVEAANNILYRNGLLSWKESAMLNSQINKKKSVAKSDAYKNKILSEIWRLWLALERKQVRIIDYLKKNGMSRVAIYGMGEIGQEVLVELEGSDVDVVCCIDKRVKIDYEERITVIKDIESIPEVDIIIVTPVLESDELADSLKRKGFNALQLKNILYDLCANYLC